MVNFQTPLQWVSQQPRTKRPERARFGKHSLSSAGRYIEDELRLLGAKNCIISTNLRVKIDGGFYANQTVEDPGVAIYFELKDKDKAMACDLWDKPEHNLWALYLSLSAIRGLERWGGSNFLDGLFTGFKALPSPENVTNITPRYFSEIDNLTDLKEEYKELAKKLHPDNSETGDSELFQDMTMQYNQRVGNL